MCPTVTAPPWQSWSCRYRSIEGQEAPTVMGLLLIRGTITHHQSLWQQWFRRWTRVLHCLRAPSGEVETAPSEEKNLWTSWAKELGGYSLLHKGPAMCSCAFWGWGWGACIHPLAFLPSPACAPPPSTEVLFFPEGASFLSSLSLTATGPSPPEVTLAM